MAWTLGHDLSSQVEKLDISQVTISRWLIPYFRRNVYKTLHGVGDDGVTAVGYDLMAHAFAEPEYQGYKITVTGHSLGAGAATILSFMLRAR